MKIKIGVGADSLARANNFKDTSIFSIQDGNNYHRIVAGVAKKEVVWWPTRIAEKDQNGTYTGKEKKINRACKSAGEDVFNEIALAEQAQITEVRENSSFKKRPQYLYIVIDRRRQKNGESPYVGLVEYNWTIHDGLQKKAEAIDDLKSVPLYGPLGSWDHIVIKTGSGMHGKGRTSYSVEVADKATLTPEEELEVKKFVCYLNNKQQCGCFLKHEECYNASECLVQNNTCTINMEQFAKADSADEIIQLLRDYPMDLDSDKCKRPEAIIPVLKKYNLEWFGAGGTAVVRQKNAQHKVDAASVESALSQVSESATVENSAKVTKDDLAKVDQQQTMANSAPQSQPVQQPAQGAPQTVANPAAGTVPNAQVGAQIANKTEAQAGIPKKKLW